MVETKKGAQTSVTASDAATKPTPVVKQWPIGYHHPDWLKRINGTDVPYPFYEIMDEVRQFQARDGDIAICTFPKCGTTWMNAIVEMLTHEANPECLHDGKSLEWKNPYLELTDPDWAEERRPVRLLAKLPTDVNRTYFTHLGYDVLPETIKKTAKIVFVVRNPKDTIVSMYHFNRSHYPLQFHGDLQEMINGFTEDRVTYGPFFDHTASYWSRRNDPNIFCTSFEELSADFLSVIRRLAKFLGKDLTEDQLHTTMYECAFDQMKNNDTVNKAAVGARGYFDFNKSPFIRAGKVGNWKAHFSPEQNQQVDDWINKNLQRPELQGLSFRYE